MKLIKWLWNMLMSLKPWVIIRSIDGGLNYFVLESYWFERSANQVLERMKGMKGSVKYKLISRRKWNQTHGH